MRLQARRIVVTGGVSGIGRATVDLFLREGAQVAVLDIDAAGLAAAAFGSGAHAIVCDVRNPQAVEAAIEAAGLAMGGIDGVVNCAGLANAVPFEQTDFETWKAVIDTNLHGSFLVCRAATPWLVRAGGGSIVNIGSGQALHPSGSSSSYTASKGAVVSFTKTIAIELAPRQIRANVLCPGTTATPMVVKVRQENPHAIERMLSVVPMQRLGESEEIAAGILFLTSTESSFVTGAALAVDGGRTLH